MTDTPPTMAGALGRRALASLREPWLLVTSAFGGGIAWAVGIPAAEAVGVTALMLAAGAAIGALRPGEETSDWDDDPTADIRLRPGTQQAALVAALEGYVDDLTRFRSGHLPGPLVDSAIEALVAAKSAYGTARRTAAAIDALDDAVARSRAARHRLGSDVGSIADAEGRMMHRRAELAGKLQTGVAGVAEVYTKLLELSASMDSMDLAGGEDLGDVSSSLDALRGAFSELEADNDRAPELG
ncbi:hypothetical protein JCM18899A_23650 [Nocardioides sp. AN3]